jgi:hypothetical protein
MVPPAGPNQLAGLRRSLRRWIELVGGFARRTLSRRRMSERDYQRIHQDLLTSCRALANSPDAPQRELGRRLEKLVGPWLTCGALEQANQQVLLDLLDRCRQAELDLGVRRLPLGVWRLALAGALAAGTTALVAWLVVTNAIGWGPAWSRLQSLAQPVWLFVRQLGAVPAVLAGGAVVVVIAVILVATAARR